jgi:hypothetical protein
MQPRILHMTLHRIWFQQIAEGIKPEEYREIKPYWTKRLAKEYDAILFKNGYAKNCPSMLIEYKGYVVKQILHPITNKKETVYAIKLGNIIEINNYDEIQQKNGKAYRNANRIRRLYD